MKKLILFGLVILLSISLQAQEKKEVNVSEKVKSEFSKLYPNSKDVKWSKDSNILDRTNALFIQRGKQIAVIFMADTLFARMIETEIVALPKSVKNHLDKYYKDYSIIRAGKMHFVSKPDKNNIAYGAEITNGTISKRVMCYPNGKEMSVSNLPDKKEK
jgi:hypothetical protein